MKYTTTLLFLLFTTISFCQGFTIDQSVDPEQMIIDFFQNDSVTVSNVSTAYDGSNMGFFDKGDTDFPIGAGIVISTGSVEEIPFPHDYFGTGLTTGLEDYDINLAAGNTSGDAAILEFDFVPTNDQLLDFKYVFASEEYPEFVGTGFNDAFLFLISGPGINGPYSNGAENAAMVPGFDDPVSINNVNANNNPDLYIDNSGGQYLMFDAYTTELPATFYVDAGETYHAKIVVADVGDHAYDSAIFLGYNSLGNSDSLVPPTEFELQAFNNEVLIDNASKYATDYSWDFGNGITSNEKTPIDIAFENTGTYTVSLTTSNYCCSNTFTGEIEITNLSLAVQTNVVQNVSCNGLSDGEVFINVAGGTGEYTIEISPNVSNYSQLYAGNYELTITDGENEITDSFVITEPEQLFAETSSDDSDENLNNGFASVSIEGGTSPYSILWSTGETTTYINNLAPGNYSFDIIDANGCTTSGGAIINTIYPPMETTVNVLKNVSCFNGEDGAVEVSITGGNAPYAVTFTPAIVDLVSIPAAIYTVTILDEDGQSSTLSFEITQPEELLMSENVEASEEGQDNGSISIELSGGTEPYTILWSNGEDTETITNLAPSTYTVEVKDANDCIITGSYEVGSFVSVFDEEIKEFGLNPNPTTGIIILSEVPNNIANAVIIDMTGKELNIDIQKITEQGQLNVTDLVNGVYVLKLIDSNGTIYSSKFIKE